MLFYLVTAVMFHFTWIFLDVARNTEAGLKAVEQLKAEGLNPKFHQLDISDKKSIADLKSYLQATYGGLDLLINNAAIAYKVKCSNI